MKNGDVIWKILAILVGIIIILHIFARNALVDILYDFIVPLIIIGFLVRWYLTRES
jgi:hypothetical protein